MSINTLYYSLSNHKMHAYHILSSSGFAIQCSNFIEIWGVKECDLTLSSFSISSAPTQPWHDLVNPDLRQHLVRKL